MSAVFPKGDRKRYVATVSIGAIAAVLMAGVAQPAWAQGVYEFDVPRGDLASVVTRIARTAGTPISFPAGLANGLVAGPVAGRSTVDSALTRALTGTGLVVESSSGGSLTIRKPAGPAAGAVEDLEAIDVTDAGTGPYNDRGFQAGNAGDTIRIADAPAKDIPLSVTGVTQQVIRSQALTTTTDAVQNVAGVTVAASSTGIGRPVFTIRGFQNAGYAVNGMQTGQDSTVPIDGVERVEVLKGPTSILTGVSSEGGLVNVTLKQPTAETIRELTVRYGSYNYKTLALDLGGPINGAEGLTYRFVASGNHADRNYSGYRNPSEVYFAPSLRWTGEDLTILAGLQYTRSHVVPTSYTFIPGVAVDPESVPRSPQVYRVPRGGVPLGNPNFGGTSDTLTLNTDQSYFIGRIFGMDATINNKFQYSQSNSSNNLLSIDTSALGPRQFSVQTYNNSRFSNITDRVDLKLKYDAGFAQQTLQFGYDYIDTIVDAGSDIGSEIFQVVNVLNGRPNIPISNRRIDSIVKSTSNTEGIYVIDKFDTLDNRLHILGSVRHDRFSDSTGPENPTRSLEKGLSWVAGAAYDVTPWLTVYGNRSDGYVPGGVIRNRIKPPEGRDLAEIGSRLFLFDKRLTLTTSWFDLMRTNVTQPDFGNPDPNAPFILIGSQRSRGVEIEAQGEIVPGLNLIASFTNLAVVNLNQIGLDNYVSGVPKQSGSLWMTYTVQDSPYAGLTFGGGVRAYSRSLVNANYAGALTLPGYAVASAVIAFERDDYSVSLKIDNLFNEYGIMPSYSSSFIGLEQGRSAVLTARYKF